MSKEGKQNQAKQSSQPNAEPEIRSRVFFKENFGQSEPVIRGREISKMSKEKSNK